MIFSKKKGFLQISIACLLFSFASADVPNGDKSVKSFDTLVSDASQTIEKNLQTPSQESDKAAKHRQIGSSANFKPQDAAAGVFITAEALYWNVKQSGLEFAIKQNNRNTTTLVGKEYSTGNAWDWGVRAGIGYNMMHDDWDVEAVYTHFNTSNRKSFAAQPNQTLYDTIDASSTTFTTVGNASARWSLNFNQIDLDMGRALFLGKWLSVRPHAGLRTTWIHQQQKVKYSGGQLATLLESPESTYLKCNFWGIGVKGGLGTNWGLGMGFSLYSDVSLSLLAGYIKPTSKQKQGTSATVVNDLQDSYRTTKTAIDLNLGVQWDKTFYERYHLGINVGWEQHMYPNMWQWQAVGYSPTPNGDFSTSGWAFGARFDF
jgi:hypothetical protein